MEFRYDSDSKQWLVREVAGCDTYNNHANHEKLLLDLKNGNSFSHLVRVGSVFKFP